MNRRTPFTNIKIKTQIILIYTSIVLISFFVSSIFFVSQNQKFVRGQLGGVAMQTMQALNENLNLIFENVMQFSNMIYFDSTMQKKLKEAEVSDISYDTSKEIHKSLINMLLSGDYISSVQIFDLRGNHILAYKRGPLSLKIDRIEEASWYEAVQKMNGDILFVGGEESILSYRLQPEKKMVSLIRTIADVDTYQPLATLLVNIDETTFQEHFDKVGEEYQSQFCIISGDRYIVKPSSYSYDLDRYVFGNQISQSGYQVINLDGEQMILTQQKMGIQDWKLIGFMPVQANSYLSDYYGSLLFFIIVINLLFVFICTLYITKLIFKPLNHIEEHMHLVELGEFLKIPTLPDRDNEIEHVKTGFNQMVEAVQRLLKQVKEEERIIRKSELDMIQEQINPHFLYNTLDAISALILIEDMDNSFLMIQSLGRFYRNSLNSGKDMIRVRDEIDCIKSYMTILNIRYDNKIMMEYEIEEDVMDLDILKLILQPVIENAVHHGIRNHGGCGTIHLSGYRDEQEIIFVITDNGIGMTQERIDEVMEGRSQTNQTGFGLYSSMQRISLFYNIEKPISINSEIGSGTEVIVCVKVRNL